MAMQLIAFETKYGRKVVGGRFGDLIRSASTSEDLQVPLERGTKELVKRAEREHKEAINKHRKEWNLPDA